MSENRVPRRKGLAANIVVGVIVAAVFAVALVALVVTHAAAPGDARLRALVHDGDGGVHELPLDEDAELPVVTSLGANTVVVEDGSVYVRDADCDNQDCVRQGRISTPGAQIICLPHKLWVEVVAQGEAGGQMDTARVAGGEGYDTIAR